MNDLTPRKSSSPGLHQQSVAEAIEEAGGPTKCARSIGGTTQSWCFYRDGQRPLPERYGARLERLAGGRVTRAQMWPNDYAVIWPELATAPPECQGVAQALQPTAPTGQGVAHA